MNIKHQVFASLVQGLLSLSGRFYQASLYKQLYKGYNRSFGEFKYCKPVKAVQKTTKVFKTNHGLNILVLVILF